MRKDIFLFRHGETDFNKRGLVQGQTCDIGLNEIGVEQAKKLAEKLQDINLQVIFSSPLQRALQTAEIIAKSKNIPVIIEKGFIEINLGEAEGKRKSELDEEEFRLWMCWEEPSFAFKGGEDRIDAERRAMEALGRIINTEYDIIGVATHGALTSTIFHFFGIETNYNLPQGRAFHIIYEDGKFELIKDFDL